MSSNGFFELILQEVDLTANRLKTVESSVLHLTGLERLSLRQNLLEDASCVEHLRNAENLKRLELRDNHI